MLHGIPYASPSAAGRTTDLSRSVAVMTTPMLPLPGLAGIELEDALLAVELELMRTPAIARLNGARRRNICAGILVALGARGSACTSLVPPAS